MYRENFPTSASLCLALTARLPQEPRQRLPVAPSRTDPWGRHYIRIAYNLNILHSSAFCLWGKAPTARIEAPLDLSKFSIIYSSKRNAL
jgi:hypothetical protein